MWLTITLILAAMVTLVALELWFFWRLGERNDARRRARLRRRLSEVGEWAPGHRRARTRDTAGEAGSVTARRISGPVLR